MAQKLINKALKERKQAEKVKVLVIEDEPSVRLGISCLLEDTGYRVISAENGLEGINHFEKEGFDIVITDIRLPGADGFEILKGVKGISPDTGVIMITAFADVKTAVEAMKEGAYDYIAKPFEPEELLIVLERFIKHKELELENIRLRDEVKEYRKFQNIISINPDMQAIFEKIEIVAKTDSSAIIYGESGTGKELVANAIHALSHRNNRPFIKINCAAIPETLLESELFGHEKGAFTGASQRRKGKFEAADGGTMFFDEIGDMPQSLQAKLLRVLETQTFERLGGNEQISVNVRTIYATRKDLKEEVREGRFREDLYYRINVLPILLLPLRDRREDIPVLVEYFIKLFSEKADKPKLSVSPLAMELLSRYNYPGNVRELKNALETAVTFCKGNTIEPCCLPPEIRGEVEEKTAVIRCDELPLSEKLRLFEMEIIAHTLEKADGKKKDAAKILGISRETLWRKLKEYGFPVSTSDFEE